MTETVTFRIEEDIKAEMNAYPLNWSEYLREAVNKKLLELRRQKARGRMDKLRNKTKGSGISLAAEVIKWRRKH